MHAIIMALFFSGKFGENIGVMDYSIGKGGLIGAERSRPSSQGRHRGP